MTYPYVLLGLASLLFVASIWLAYEVGVRVGAYEEQRQYTRREPRWFSADNEPF
jgi:hypothetical protein